jgi:hypothetical protein
VAAGECIVSAETFRVPDDLAELDQWLVWSRENETKVPYCITGRRASSTDPATWCSYNEALEEQRRHPQRWAGIGFVFSKENQFVGIDLDNCLEGDGILKPWACGIVERFSDSYCEISPSGVGLKIWARGSLPSNVAKVPLGDGGIELYSHSRYFAVTVRAFRGAPLQVEDHAGDLLLLYERLTAGRQRWPLQPLRGGRIPYGQQHSTLISIVGTLRARRVCDEAILACVQLVNQQQCERPGPPDHIARIVRSSRNWGAR